MKFHGIGISSMLYGIGYGFSRPDFGSADVEVAPDGTVTIWNGASELGQGIQTLLCQFAAEELGIPYENVNIISADTAKTTDAGPVSASRSTYIQGNAVIKACQNLRTSMAETSAILLGTTPDHICFRNNRVFPFDDPTKSITFQAVASELYKRGLCIHGFGWHNMTTEDVDPETAQGDAYATYAWASQLAEVEVDTDTGQVNVLLLVSATDAGRAINPRMVEGQIIGGAVQGLGFALTENMIVEEGVFKNSNFSTYLIPTAADIPEKIEPLIVEVPDPSGPYGAKGIGEPATIPTAPAILNAITNAIGKRIYQTPASPERILQLLGTLTPAQDDEIHPEDISFPND